MDLTVLPAHPTYIR